MQQSSEEIEYLDYKRPPKSQRPIVIQSHQISLLPLLLEWGIKRQTQQPRKIVKEQRQQQPLITILKPKFSLSLEYKQYRIKVKIADFVTEKADVLLLPLLKDDCNQYPQIKQELTDDIQQMKLKGVERGSLYTRIKKLLNYKIRAFFRTEQQFGVENLINGLEELIDLTFKKKISVKSIGFILPNERRLMEFVSKIGDIEIVDNDARFEFVLFLRKEQSFVELAKIISSL